MGKTRKFFRDAVFYSTSNIFANILNFITGVMVRHILRPAAMGLFNEILLVFDYARYSHFGIIDSLDRELPYLYGSKNYDKVKLLRNIGFSFCIIISVFISIVLFIASIVLRFKGDVIFASGLYVVMCMVALQLLNSFYTVLNRAKHNFSVISINTILVAIFDIGIKIFLTIKFGLFGLLWASVLSFGMGLVYFYRASRQEVRFILYFPYQEIIRLLKIGFPIFIMGFIYLTLRNVDRIMIIRLLDRESLGFYTIALMASVYAVQVPNLIYAVIFPRFYQAYGEKQSIHKIKELFINPTLVFAYFFPILIGFAILALPLLINYMLPAYKPGIAPAYLLLLGSSFLALVNMPAYLLIALNKQIYMVVIGVIGICLGLPLNYIFIKIFHLGITGAAVATSITYFLYATLLMSYAFSHYTKNIFAHIKFFFQLYFPFLWVVIVLMSLRAFIASKGDNLTHDCYVVFLKGIFFILACIPLVIYVNKKTSVVSLIKKSYVRSKGNE